MLVMTGHSLSFVFIMLVVGAVSGVISYFTPGPKQSLKSCLLWRFIMLVVSMTFFMPFILSMFGSTLYARQRG